MKIFPDYWANPQAMFAVVPTPIGQHCTSCDIAIVHGDSGVIVPHLGMTRATELPWHRSCFLRSLGISE